MAVTYLSETKAQRRRKLRKKMWSMRVLYLMIIVGAAYFFIFRYATMYGVLIAFKNFKARQGIWGSEWVGMKNFHAVFSGRDVILVFQNTVHISLMKLLTGFPAPIILAIMEKPQRDCVRRIIGWDIHGLESAVKIDGRLNDPTAQNTGWSLEIRIPWFSLRECGKDECYPTRFAPEPGEIWRMNFSRVEWDVDVRDGRYVKRADKATGEPLPEHNWVWAPTGVIDIHMPEMWGYLVFTREGERYPLPRADAAKLLLRKLYYREHAHCCQTGQFTADVALLLGDEAAQYNLRAYVTPSMFEGALDFEGETWHIRQDGYLWQGDEY